MENITDALHIAFGVLVFVLALSITMSSFSLAKKTATSIIYDLDKREQYEYEQAQTTTNASGETEITGTNRIVGTETIIPTLYRAAIENYIVRFYKKDGSPIYLYRISEDNNKTFKDTNAIDLEKNKLGDHELAKDFIKHFIKGDLVNFFETQKITGKYRSFKALESGKTFSDLIGNKKFIETLGVYYQEDIKPTATEDINKTKKRVITYTEVE